MEPPAKRLRILQSVDVDEEDPEYINAKRKQQERTKSRMESIFAKYEHMHESMSDDIDMRTNSIVVDRGHLRRLNRQVNRKETILLDTLGMAAGDEREPGSGSEDDSEDSEDELAPTQPPKTKKRRFEDTVESAQTAQPPPVTPANATNQAVEHFRTQPSSAASLLQLVSFPQTPAGQQAQTTFITTLAHTINQAVQQAVAPLFSNFLPVTPLAPLPLANTLPTDDPVKPATDPKWYFPPLSVGRSKSPAVQSSPLPALTSRKSEEKAVSEHVRKDVLSEDECPAEGQNAQSVIIPQNLEAVGSTLRRNSPIVNIRTKPRGPPRKYVFTDEDDIFISKRKILHKRTWQEIKNSKEKWKNWPLSTFHTHWNRYLRGRELHLTAMSATSIGVSKASEPASEHDVLSHSPAHSHHLPTPSSLEQEGSCNAIEHDPKEHVFDLLTSSSHFDDDELELLSLAGADSDNEQPCLDNEDEEPVSHTTEDMILPSVETEEFVDEDMLQQGLLATSSPVESTFPIATTIKTEPVEPTPNASKQMPKYRVISYQPDDDDTTDEEVNALTYLMCAYCPEVFKCQLARHRHEVNTHERHDKPPRKKSGSINLVGADDDDEIQVPTTPYIKREPSTPPRTALLISTPAFQAPKPFALGARLHSSGSKSTGKVDRRAYLKQVKQSWTKKATPGSKVVAKRRSLNVVPVKRGWEDDDDDVDELA